MNRDIYMGAPVALTTLANGAVTNAAAQERLRQTSYLEPTADRVTSDVTCFGGDGFLNLTLIEGGDGLIVYDTGEVLEDGERFLSQIRAISDKPIVAVIYSHSHYVAGTTPLVGNGDDVRVIGHPKLNENLATGMAGSSFPETAPVNTPVEDGQRMRIAGVEMQFFTRFGSDTDDCLTVLLPETGVVLNNLLWPFLPNIYTLRGSKFRDPREWRDGLKLIRSLGPRALVNTHARAVRGRDACREVLDGVIDALNCIHDQTLRGILRGLGPDELRSFVKLPPHLADHPHNAEIYGEISHFGPYLFNHALGWFDGDAASINPLARGEQAQRLVEAMGGTAAVLERARVALSTGEHAWAAQLLTYLQRLAPRDQAVRALAPPRPRPSTSTACASIPNAARTPTASSRCRSRTAARGTRCICGAASWNSSPTRPIASARRTSSSRPETTTG